MTNISAKTYSSKSTAVRGAKRAGLDKFEVFVNEDGTWTIAATPAPVEIPVETPAPVEAKAKVPSYKELYSTQRSAVLKPFSLVHSFLDANPNLGRKAAIAELVAKGVNYSTARTQYQRWFAKRKG